MTYSLIPCNWGYKVAISGEITQPWECATVEIPKIHTASWSQTHYILWRPVNKVEVEVIQKLRGTHHLQEKEAYYQYHLKVTPPQPCQYSLLIRGKQYLELRMWCKQRLHLWILGNSKQYKLYITPELNINTVPWRALVIFSMVFPSQI
jgi:hypothetical protein